MLEIKNVKKTFGKKQVLKDISLEIKPGRIYGLLGNNGQGKTTLSKITFNEYTKNQGEIFYNDIPQTQIDYTEWFFFSENNELPKNISVKSYISMIISLTKLSKQEVKKRHDQIMTFFTSFDIKKNQNIKIKNLSSGQQKLLSLYICFLIKPKVIFLDEPTANLDIQNKKMILDAIKQLKQNSNIIVLITHLIEEVKELIEEIIILDNGNITYKGNVDKNVGIKELFYKYTSNYQNDIHRAGDYLNEV